MSTDTEEKMRRIWHLTTSTDAGQARLSRSTTPWLIENALDETGNEVFVRFPDGRKKSELPIWERKQRFIQSLSYLVSRAEIARNLASSWRDFHVGTALLAFREGYRHEDSWGVFTGMNIKHARNMRPTCSEPIALGAAIASGFDLIIGMVVIGELNDGVETKTLHPCKDCRWCLHGYMHEDLPKLRIVDSDTLIHTRLPHSSPSGSASEFFDVGGLLSLHKTISNDEF